jgi:hypothetical protein
VDLLAWAAAGEVRFQCLRSNVPGARP